MASALGGLLSRIERPHATSTPQLRSDSSLLAQLKDLREEYYVIYHESMKQFADDLNRAEQTRFKFILYTTTWEKFDDDADNIQIKEISKPTHFKGKNILFIASFHSNHVTMSQFHVIAHLCESFAESLTVLLPYYTTSTMERVDIGKDSQIPTANTLARLFNGLPSMGYPVRLMTYDLHTLQNRFYVTGNAIASLHTAAGLMREFIASQEPKEKIDALAFPDAGAHKRFANLFETVIGDEQTITCGKTRIEGSDTKITEIISGKNIVKSCNHILIVDDTLKSGSTLAACALKLREQKTDVKISVFTTHAVFTNKTEKFTSDGQGLDKIECLYTTNSIPNEFHNAENNQTLITKPSGTPIKVNLDHRKIHIFNLVDQVLKDL